MPARLISAPLVPDRSFDVSSMASGAPGVPGKFHWGKSELVVAEILDRDKEYGDCTHGSGERYLRKHVYRIRTADGLVARIYFLRSFGRARAAARWWLHSFET